MKSTMRNFIAENRKFILFAGIVNFLIFILFNLFLLSKPVSFRTRTNFILPYVRSEHLNTNRQMWNMKNEISRMIETDTSRDGFEWNFWESADKNNIFFDVVTPQIKIARPSIDNFINHHIRRFCEEIKPKVRDLPPVCASPMENSGLNQTSFRDGSEVFFPPRYQITFEDRRSVPFIGLGLFAVYFVCINVFLLLFYYRTYKSHDQQRTSALR